MKSLAKQFGFNYGFNYDEYQLIVGLGEIGRVYETPKELTWLYRIRLK